MLPYFSNATAKILHVVFFKDLILDIPTIKYSVKNCFELKYLYLQNGIKYAWNIVYRSILAEAYL